MSGIDRRSAGPPNQEHRPLTIAIALIWHEGRLLIARRPEGVHLGGLWEFPGGKREPGETLEDCLKREVCEELGIAVEVIGARTSILHHYADCSVELHPFDCRWTNDAPAALEVAEWRWVRPEELPRFRFPPANDGLIERLVAPLV